ncbi:hypothetical protein M9H77_06174 [Catharanthus roseus]|uniref:Uncharacterized protein n=1 Tax=Catharanthus roseus TaxID=4058 RepID=A0ACC0BRI7_CATRO|nr:hypothetical protein M9H77_06174 [Catharanthus roseus]
MDFDCRMLTTKSSSHQIFAGVVGVGGGEKLLSAISLLFHFDSLLNSICYLAMAYTSILEIFLIISLLTFCTLAQDTATIPVGSRLTADGTSRPWLSLSGDFAFGFRQTQDNRDLFVLSVWYNNIPDQTIAWFPNSIDPVPIGSTLDLNSTTGLVLRDPQGRQLWRSEGISDEVHHGVMNETGNFILKRRDFSWVWETFQFAADTILPFQELVYGTELVSRKSETNFSRGRFFLQFRDSGNLVLTTRSFPTNSESDAEYYNSQTSDTSNNGSLSGVRVVFDASGSIYIQRRNNETKFLSPSSLPPVSENYFRATLNFDGVFTLYHHPRTFTGRPNWNPLMNIPDNICVSITGQKGSGACGYNSVCRIVNERPVCECPQGYQLINPNDNYGSCSPNFTIGCGRVDEEEEVYDFVEISNIDWPLADYEMFTDFTEENCRKVCLNDCLCAVAIFRNSTCWKKKLPLSNGRVDVRLNSKALLKYNKREIPQIEVLPKPKKNRILITVGSVLLGSSVFINLLFIFTACFGFYLIYGKKKRPFPSGNKAVETNLRIFTYKELEEATNGFKEEVGRGSFGIVYKGIIRNDSKRIVAVKKLDRVAQDSEKEFRAEVNAIGQTHHKNLVRLIGFCDQGQHRMLVYEYMNNGTLSSFLFNNPKPSWNLRTQIAIGIARGLAYLHEECSNQIIHCDIKPQNVLLDEYYNARISDFGLAKLLVLNQSRTLTNIRGTKGYVAPEWFRNIQVTAKVDVYSFGVVLLEIISCRRCLEDVEIGDGENPILVDWVWDCFQEGRLDSLVQNDVESLNDKERLERFVKVGIWCIQEESSLRPSMRKVSQMLEGAVEVRIPPCPSPPFLSSA